jgi:hypothetical protein
MLVDSKSASECRSVENAVTVEPVGGITVCLGHVRGARSGITHCRSSAPIEVIPAQPAAPLRKWSVSGSQFISESYPT